MGMTTEKLMATTEMEMETLTLYHWYKVVELLHAAFQEVRLAEESMWQAVVMISKEGGNYRVICLLEVVWKVVTVILNQCLATSNAFHDVLHGFRSGRCTGTASLGTKLLQHLKSTSVEVLYAIFLNLNKVYGALYRDICM